MKTTKRTIGAFAFLAALIMMVSVMTPLADAGADNSAPVLFSNESEASSDKVLGTWTSNEGSFYLTYTETPGAKYPYMLTFTLNSSFPLTEFQTAIKFSLNDNLSSKPIMTGSFAKKDLTDLTSPKLGLTEKLVPGKYTFTVSDPNTGRGGSDFSDFVEFTIGASVDVTISSYFESAESAKTAINAVWDGSEVTDVADKTMFVIYEQVGTFDKDVIGELYFNSEKIYFETLNNEEGQRIWYFTFNQPNANGKSIPYAPGEYTMKLVSDGVVITETTAEISGVVPTYEVAFTIIPDVTYSITLYDADKNPVGKTGEKYLLPDGKYTYKIMADGYKDSQGTFTVDGETTIVKVTLVPETSINLYGVTLIYNNHNGIVTGTTQIVAGQPGFIHIMPVAGKVVDSVSITDGLTISDISGNKSVWKFTAECDVTITITFADPEISYLFKKGIDLYYDASEAVYKFNIYLSAEGGILPNGKLCGTYTYYEVDNGRYVINTENIDPYEIDPNGPVNYSGTIMKNVLSMSCVFEYGNMKLAYPFVMPNSEVEL